MKVSLALFLLSLLTSCASAAEPAVTDLHVIELHDGANPIDKFDQVENRDGFILRVWRGNGNAHGYNVYLTMLRSSRADNCGGWCLVDIVNGDMELDTLRDDPLTGEDNAFSVWFAKGKLEGKPATFLFTGERNLARVQSSYDPVPVTITSYHLVVDGDVGYTPVIFQRLSQHQTVKLYRNSERAMAEDLHLPVPSTVRSDADCANDGTK